MEPRGVGRQRFLAGLAVGDPARPRFAEWGGVEAIRNRHILGSIRRALFGAIGDSRALLYLFGGFLFGG